MERRVLDFNTNELKGSISDQMAAFNIITNTTIKHLMEFINKCNNHNIKKIKGLNDKINLLKQQKLNLTNKLRDHEIRQVYQRIDQRENESIAHDLVDTDVDEILARLDENTMQVENDNTDDMDIVNDSDLFEEVKEFRNIYMKPIPKPKVAYTIEFPDEPQKQYKVLVNDIKENFKAIPDNPFGPFTVSMAQKRAEKEKMRAETLKLEEKVTKLRDKVVDAWLKLQDLPISLENFYSFLYNIKVAEVISYEVFSKEFIYEALKYLKDINI